MLRITHRLFATATLGLALCGTAQGVYLNPRGSGQVLIFPYYTVNANQSTLFSVVNTTPNGKALRLQFHEAYNGRDALDFNVYLSPYDVWTAEIYLGSGDDAPAVLATSDNSCTYPTVGVVNFSTAAFTGSNSDTGPQDGARTREGDFDVIEMGEIIDGGHGTLAAISHVDGVPANCSKLSSAWATGGYWAADPTADLAPPSGGLYGAESIVDVPQGTVFMVDAAALDGFSARIQHTQPGTGSPALDSVNDGAGTSGATAFVPLGNKLLQLHYDRPVDAVSALFMTDTLYNEYEVDPAYGAQTDWVVTFPTKHFYVDETSNPNIKSWDNPPFDVVFGLDGTTASFSPFWANVFDREGSSVSLDYGCFGNQFPPQVGFYFETNVLTFDSTQSLLSSALVSIASTIRDVAKNDKLPFLNGNVALSLVSYLDGCLEITPVPDHALTASTEGDVLYGMPALGFAARGYVNANATNGVLANYTAAVPHRSSVSCANIKTNPPGPCS